jgi:hypothetical protein
VTLGPYELGYHGVADSPTGANQAAVDGETAGKVGEQ